MTLAGKPSDKRLFASTQSLLEIFVFFSVFPAIKIFGITITFFIFILIIVKFIRRKKKIFRIQRYTVLLLLLFVFFVFMSWVLQEDTVRQSNDVLHIKLMIQYVYWVVLALFIKTWIYNYDFYRISRAFLVGSATAAVYYILLNSFHLVYYPNSFAYTLVTALPVGYYYAFRRFSMPVLLLISFGFLMSMLLSGSRTGTALLMLEIFLLFMLGGKIRKKVFFVLMVALTPLLSIYVMTIDDYQIKKAKYAIADVVEDYSPKIAHTLRLEENVLERDKSLLIRKLMLQKGEKIFEQHPFFGVGPGNFTYYFVPLDIAEVSHWLRGTEGKYNRTSSQNSYIMILTENGIFALISILIVFFYILYRGFPYLLRFRDNAEMYIYIPFLSLMFYGVILVTTLGTLFWLFLGLALTLIQRHRRLT